MAYQLGAKPLPKPMMTLPEGANLCEISINFCTVYAAVSIILMTYRVILYIFSSFFKFRWKIPISSMKPLWFSLSGIELANKNTTEKYLYSAYFYWYFSYSSIFKLFKKNVQFLPLIFSRKPWHFPAGSNEHVNSNTTVKYWYAAPFCCCFFNFLQGKILPIHPYSNFFNLYPSFFHFKWKKPISFRKPSQFLVSLPIWKEHVNSSIYIQHIFGCFTSFEIYSFLQRKIFT